jgi:Novel toxin 15
MNARHALRSTPSVPALLLFPLVILFGEVGARAGDFPRDVKGKPAFSSVGEKRFDSAAEACRQWIKENFPKDSYVRVEEANEQSFWCHRKEPDGSPQFQAAVYRAIKCPDNAHEVGGHDLPCECNDGLVAAGDVCKPETAASNDAPAPAPAPTPAPAENKPAEAKVMSPHKVECFNAKGVAKTPAKLKEYKAQLGRQEAALRDMTLADFFGGMAWYADKRAAGRNEPRKESAAAQKELREAEKKKLVDTLTRDLKSKGMTDVQIKSRLQRAVKKFDSLAALHEPDICVAGSKVTCMGDKSVNSSIGSQWPLPRGAYEDDSRRYRLLAAVMNALETLDPDAKVNVVLETCP